MIGMGLFEVVVSHEIPDIGEMWWFSVMATITSFRYASIKAALAFSTCISSNEIKILIFIANNSN